MIQTCNCGLALLDLHERLRNLERLHGFELAAIKCSDRIAKPTKWSMQSKLKAVAELTAEQFSMTLDDLQSKSRRESVAVARFVACKLQRDLCAADFDTLATFWGKSHHSWASYAVARAEELVESSESMRAYDATLRASFAEALR